MGLTAHVDISELNNAFSKAPSIVESEINRAAKTWLVEVQVEAKARHRYKSHSHDLEKSVDQKYINMREGGAVVLNTGTAIYGPRMHRGWGTWNPDEFLFRAAEKKEPKLTELIESAIGKALKRIGF
jgi:hypothetical protein